MVVDAVFTTTFFPLFEGTREEVIEWMASHPELEDLFHRVFDSRNGGMLLTVTEYLAL